MNFHFKVILAITVAYLTSIMQGFIYSMKPILLFFILAFAAWQVLILNSDFNISRKNNQITYIAYIAITDLSLSLCFVLVPMFTRWHWKKTPIS